MYSKEEDKTYLYKIKEDLNLIQLKVFGQKITFLVEHEENIIVDNDVFILDSYNNLQDVSMIPTKYSSCFVLDKTTLLFGQKRYNYITIFQYINNKYKCVVPRI